VSVPERLELVERIAAFSTSRGLDLVHPFAVSWYNRAVAMSDRLSDFGREGSLAVLIGNTGALWPLFTERLRQEPTLAAAEHPLDTYVESSVAALVSELGALRSVTYFGHVTQPKALPIQRLAELVGFAAIAPSHLAIHPVHGPWLALRAVLVLDAPGPSGEPPPLPRPCLACTKPCMPAFERALEASGMPLSSRSIALHADSWIAVRDACPIGKASRYEPAQLRYHYRNDRSALQGS
jgi:methylmalonic aciduria homocystinuria type C protein